MLKFKYIDDWSKILSSIFNSKIEIVNSNESKQKPYYKKYKNFKENYAINEQIINHFINESHFLKYNTLEEQKQYIQYLRNYL